VTNPGPSSRNKIFPRLAGDFLISFLEEFMARSSNKAVQISRFFYAPQPTLPRLDDADLALGSVSTWAILGCKCRKKASVDGAIRRNRPTPTQHRSHHLRATHRQRQSAGISKKIGPLHDCLGTHTPLTAASTLTKSKYAQTSVRRERCAHTTKNRTEVLCPRITQAAMIAAASFGLRRSGRFATATSGAAYGPHQ
jgi:hypothetical protein